MYVTPNTDVRILTGVPLNNDYDNTFYFATPQAQSAYFFADGRAKFILNNHSYQRKSRGWIKVNIPQNQLWDCSYLMYRNSSYGTKWFYAFILATEYINDNNTLINFEIDVIQTWMFDYQLQPCYVEREHSETDNLFENLVEEDLALGDDYVIETTTSFDLTPTSLMILSNDNFANSPSYDPITDDFIDDKYYYPIKRYGFDLVSSASKRRLVDYMNLIKSEGQEEAILQIFQYPEFMGEWGSTAPITTATKNFTPHLTSMNGYVPKNKKLFTYPYNFLHITNHEGVTADFKWELWDYKNGHIGEFTVKGCSVGKPAVVMYPNNYRNVVNDVDSGIYATNFPENPWIGDAWKLFWAQHGESYNTAVSLGWIESALKIGGFRTATREHSSTTFRTQDQSQFSRHVNTTTYSGNNVSRSSTYSNGTGSESDRGSRSQGGTYVTENMMTPLQGVVNLAGTIAKDVAFQHDLQHQPNQSYGEKNANVLTTFIGMKHFGFQQYTIKAQFAQIIDEYFSRFGYACKRIKVPNRNARQNWTYTKTIGCEITASIPDDDAKKIKQIYDNGITFWNDPLNLGNFGDFTNPVYST